ncbi:3-keto-5-aminohexanoate cleavage protein [Desulfoglaeba alkanexedens]|uniref:3-keto-5-aminohexanoate cleavage protein n=1 Tax=Desulfoglaeba alkanexedens ALDC TaxID=980445 RepID=A0A4P8L6Z5_9BACT|nr:3-keto-5-aminohexanoate cleavage protein [Desulfoglaeba alkanexedens]QCQ22915.1 3-keto-5-aminohexanoate cleavage protein [Desulfoglaeba alkanexedens ALDC]
MAKTIVTAAITGSIHTPSMSPYLPITPDQIADDAVRAYEAGAAMVHIHVRDPKTGRPSQDLNVIGEVLRKIKSRCNVVVNTTTGAGLGMTAEERLRAIPTFKPELASFNAGSVNFALFDIPDRMGIREWKYDWEKPYLESTRDFIFANTFKTMEEFARTFEENGTKPEMEIYDSAMINNAAYLVSKGLIKKPVYLQFVMGIMGGIPPSAKNLIFLYETARQNFGNDFIWSVCAAGRHQLPMCAVALSMGGNVRVGMEDSLYAGKGVMAKSNADQVEKIVRIAKELSIDIATPDDARQILGLKGIDKVTY